MSGLFLVALPCSSANDAPPVESKTCGRQFLHYPNAQYFIVITHPSLSAAPRENTSDASEVSRHLNVSDTRPPPPPLSRSGPTGGEVAVITVDTVSGQLLHVGVPELDLFANMDEALRAIPALCSSGTHPPSVRLLSEFVALAGACLTDDALHILFVEKHEKLAAPCEVPVYAVVRAQWYSIPLRVAVSALQPARRKSIASGVAALPSLTGWDREKMCLYYSPGVDVTHCDAFTTAVRRAAAGQLWGAVGSAGDGHREGSTYCGEDAVLRWGVLPPIPAQTGRDALGRCDCLWNEELIAFCELYGLGDWCCRLALGSCTTALNELHALQTVLLVRRSRLAIPGCMGDDYESPMETEFQLMLLGQSSTAGTKKFKRDMPNGQERDMPNGQEREMPNGQEMDMPNGQERDMPNGQERDIPNGQERDIPNGQEMDIPNGQERDMPNGQEMDMPNGQERDMPNGQERDMPNGQEMDIPNGQEMDIPNGQEMDMPNVKERNMPVGIEASGLGCAPTPERGVFSVVWRCGSDFAGHPDLAAQRQRFDNYALRFIDPMPPSEDRVAGVFSAYLERYGPGTRIALVHASAADPYIAEALTALAAHVRAHALRPTVTVVTALPVRSTPLVPLRRAAAVAERCVLRICVSDVAITRTTTTITPSAVAMWLREVAGVSAPAEMAARSLLSASAALTCDTGQSELLAFAAALFPCGGHFATRAAARHRTVLLSHPAGLAAVVGARLFAPPAHSSGHTKCFPFSPMCSLRHTGNSPHEKYSNANGNACETDVGVLLRAAVHPAAPAVRLPAAAAAVEFTIALSTLAHVTHIALSVAGAVQEAPYAAPLALTLAACCYMGQAHERVVLEDVPLPLALNGPVAFTEPRLIFFALPRYCNGHSNNKENGPFETIEYAGASLGLYGIVFDDTAPVLARFLRIVLRGSGAHAMAVPPVFVFGEAVENIPPALRDAVFGRHTALRRKLRAGESSLWQSFSHTKNSITTTAPSQLPNEARHEMYVHKISDLLPSELCYVSLELALVTEAKRLQCGARRCDRELCLRRMGAPRWLLNPALHILPHSVFHRSQLPADFAVAITAKAAARAKRTPHTTGKRCTLCGRGFSWLSVPRECDRCLRSVCNKCAVAGPARLVEFGHREALATLCPPCHAQAERIDAAHEAFLLSRSGRVSTRVGSVVPTNTDAEEEEEQKRSTEEKYEYEDEDEEREKEKEEEASIDVYARHAVPRLADTLFGFPLRRTYTRRPRALLTAHPHTRVVCAPGMHEPTAPHFENALPLAGHLLQPNASWRCVAPEEWTQSTTRLQRRVVLLLPHDAHVRYGVLGFTFDNAHMGAAAVDIELHVGATLQGLRPCAHSRVTCGPEEEEEEEEEEEKEEARTEVRLDCAFDGASVPARLIALVFTGTAAGLSRLCIASFAAWGSFATLHECRRELPGEYVAKLSATRYAMRCVSVHGGHGGPNAPPCPGCLPRMLSMTRLIPLRAVAAHSRAEQFALLVEFDLGVPAIVCGFTLEQHHPAFAAAPHNAIATALRLIGVSASGCRGNMAYVQLPWPPLTDARGAALEPVALAYALPLPNHNIVSVMVEVVEWRLTNAPGVEHGGEGDNRRCIYLGKIQFWTSANALTRRVVSSGTYASIHTCAE